MISSLSVCLLMQKQPTKAQKRRQHQAERDAEREAELEAERAEQGESEQAVEDKQLREMLTPLGLTIRAIQVSSFILKNVLAETASFDQSFGSLLQLGICTHSIKGLSLALGH